MNSWTKPTRFNGGLSPVRVSHSLRAKTKTPFVDKQLWHVMLTVVVLACIVYHLRLFSCRAEIERERDRDRQRNRERFGERERERVRYREIKRERNMRNREGGKEEGSMSISLTCFKCSL